MLEHFTAYLHTQVNDQI